jgi:LemA protein
VLCDSPSARCSSCFARQYYKDAAAQLNTAVRTIPWLLFTGIAGVQKREFYDAPAAAETPPTVQF